MHKKLPDILACKVKIINCFTIILNHSEGKGVSMSALFQCHRRQPAWPPFPASVKCLSRQQMQATCRIFWLNLNFTAALKNC